MHTLEFFHDAVCGWCYLQSPRLRHVIQSFDVRVIHRSFVLQRNRQEMIARFGSMALAKADILDHWEQCRKHAEQPERINIEGMRAANFEYPSGYAAALAAKAVEQLSGQQGHWDYFDRVQTAHLCDNQNIADHDVLESVAVALGHDRQQFRQLMRSDAVRDAVERDNQRARSFGVLTIPSLLINGKRLLSQTLTCEQLHNVLSRLLPTSGDQHEID